jgi:hypothetical protein
MQAEFVRITTNSAASELGQQRIWEGYGARHLRHRLKSLATFTKLPFGDWICGKLQQLSLGRRTLKFYPGV